MSSKILVAYATTAGSTKEVAEAIAAALRECGQDVDFQAARDVRSLQSYGPVVLGAPFYMFKWHKHARRFLSRHHKALTERPVAIFATGPCFKGDEDEWRGAREMLDKMLAENAWLKPVAHEMFGGRLDPARLPFYFRIFISKMPPADLRDWDAIKAWATRLPSLLA